MTSISPASDLPLLVFGGPYSNYQALEAIRKIATDLNLPPTQIICTGDIVAYCADPEETALACREWGIHIVQGNCEDQLGAGADDCGCGFGEGTTCSTLSKSWYDYARQSISESTRLWMATLPKSLHFDLNGKKFRVIHGGVQQANEFIFPSTAYEFKRTQLSDAEADVVIAGHSGIPFVERLDDKVWFNAGVIGMPANDGTPSGRYGLIDSTRDCIKFSLHRLDYDYNTAAERLLSKGFADPYARALKTGIWPSHDVLPEPERMETGQPISKTSLEFSFF